MRQLSHTTNASIICSARRAHCSGEVLLTSARTRAGRLLWTPKDNIFVQCWLEVQHSLRRWFVFALTLPLRKIVIQPGFAPVSDTLRPLSLALTRQSCLNAASASTQILAAEKKVGFCRWSWRKRRGRWHERIRLARTSRDNKDLIW